MRAVATLLLVLTACGGDAPCAGVDCREDASASDSGDPNAVVGLRVEPQSLELDVVDGEPASGRFSAFFVEADGDERPADGIEWVLGRRDFASIDATGMVSTNADRGGEGDVYARATIGSSALEGRAKVRVRVVRTFGEGGTHFDDPPATDAAAAPVLLYPLDGSMMPRNLRPPVVQWRPANGDGDVYRVRLETPHARVVAHVTNEGGTFTHSWAVDEDAWRVLIESDPDSEITIDVDRFQASRARTVRGAGTVRMRVARGVVAGEVYYWALDRGRIYAIDPETATAHDVVPNPPPQSGGNRCIACHTVSRDGRWLFGRRFDDNAGWIVDLAGDTTTDPPPMRYAPRSGIDTAAFDPTGDRLLAAGFDGSLFVVDATNGERLASTGLPTELASMPAWSPSGTLAAWIEATSLGEESAPTRLRLAPYEGDLAFGEAVVLHDGRDAEGAEGGSVDALPSFTPDDRFVVFQHGPQAFTTGITDPQAALYLASTDGRGTWRLDATSEGWAFWPTASPYITNEADGRRFYWIAFHSRRDYGNQLAGTWGQRRRQLWIAAVDANPTAGVDPSFAPVWLPGQEREHDNVAAYWAPEPCKAEGQTCTDHGECCGGACIDGAEGRVCAAPPG